MVNDVVDDCAVDEACERMASKIAALSGPVMRLGKKCFNEQVRQMSCLRIPLIRSFKLSIDYR